MKFLDFIIRSIYPRRCVFCNLILNINDNSYICAKCADKNLWIKGKVCTKCGKPIENNGLKIEKCKSCCSLNHKFDKAYALYLYKDCVRDAIHRFKYKGKGGYSRFFGKAMADFANLNNIPCVDYVVAVPIHKKRLKERTYNQSELMAKIYCNERKQTYMPLLVRTEKTLPQNQLSRKERIKNVKGAFSINTCNEDIKDKTVLLIDDIFTTGSTVDECAFILKKAGIKEVYVLCLSINEYD